ncbi:membrane protein [bacteria symbiont BFo2 of Frankliniella occidentalis]|nr:membrane protein [bacteria symbiont BFo2 of Frankliniella occidentalis]KYP95981.1 membrane protein [bacteria symbiont BFo2 of Frankliniella occidentalis]
MNVKDLSITTVLLAALYFMAFSFYKGFSSFYGFPVSFISIGVGEIVKFSVIALGLLFTLVALLHIDTDEKSIPGWASLFFFALASLLSYGTLYFYGERTYLYEHAKGSVVPVAILLGFSSTTAVRSVSVFIRNEYKIKNKAHGVMLLISIALLPSLLGWVWAYISDEPLFYSKKYNAYVIESYNGKFVLGSCSKNIVEYLTVDRIEGKLTPLSANETQQLKICFLNAANSTRGRGG